jgi:hypothetical protein
VRRNESGNSWNNFGGNSIEEVIALEQFQVLQLEEQVLTEVVIQEEILFVEAIQQQFLINKEFIRAQDNIRINTFNNINSNLARISFFPQSKELKLTIHRTQ